jgi:hypothetical protein
MTMHIKFWQFLTAIPKDLKRLVGFEPGILRSVGGRDAHYANAVKANALCYT